MNDRWRLVANGATHTLQRWVEREYVTVAYLDAPYAREIVNTLNGVPIASLQKQVAIMGDQVEDILRRVTKLGRPA